MPGRALLLAVCVLGCLAWITGCEEEPGLPPELAEESQRSSASQPAVDLEHTITLQVDRLLSLPNIILVVQPDPQTINTLGLSILTSQPAPDGSTLNFGTFVRAESIKDLRGKEINLSSGPILNPYVSSIRTPTAVYQPKFLTLQITAFREKEAEGTFRGDFYRFARIRPGARPQIIEGQGRFKALLIMR